MAQSSACGTDMKTHLLLLVVLVSVGPASAADNPLDVYAPLAGHCWRGEFPHGKAADEHCFTWLYGGKHLRDVHVVRIGDGTEYRGETIYSWDAKIRRIVYRYWNSDGGYSDGDIVEADGELLSPEERYTSKDGREQVFRSRLRIIDAKTYEARTDSLRDGAWNSEWTITFERVGVATEEGKEARQQARLLKVFEPFVGEWLPDPDSKTLQQRPELAGTVAFRLAFGPQRKLVRIHESYPRSGDSTEAIVEGIAYFDHISNAIAFAASSRHGWTFHGGYEIPDANTLVREYDVHYAKVEEYIPYPEWDGQVRRFRETWKLVAPGRIESSLEVLHDGMWQPHFPGVHAMKRR